MCAVDFCDLYKKGTKVDCTEIPNKLKVVILLYMRRVNKKNVKNRELPKVGKRYRECSPVSEMLRSTR